MSTKTKDRELVKALPNRAATILSNFRKAVSETNGRVMPTADERSKHIESLRAKAIERLDKLTEDGQAAVARLQGTDAPTKAGDSNDQLRREMRAERAWNRTKLLLDASISKKSSDAGDPLHIIQTEIAKADADTLAVLQEELPSYLTANNLTAYADVLPTLVKTAETGGITMPLASDEEVTTGWNRTQSALAIAKYAVEQSHGKVPYTEAYSIPDYEAGELIEIEAIEETTEEVTVDGERINTDSLPYMATLD